jgi:mannan endo-1,4-beta-mannosidase
MAINIGDAPRTIFSALIVSVLAPSPLPLNATEPADPELSVEAREVLDYLSSIYGKKTLIGQDKFWEAERFHEATGKYPAIISSDLSGWSKTRWDDQYKRTLQRAVDQSQDWWHKQGGIVSFAWHWANPLTTAGTFEATRPGFAPIDVGRIVTPGTKEHETAMDDLRQHADYLEQFAKARVPVLWRPLHEIEGGWFWWSDTKTPENTAKLWRMMFDYLVHQRKLHNLIWVYSAALKAGDHGKDAETIEYRKRFYPGDKYVDISGIDIYTNAWFGWADFREDAFPKAFQIMGQVTPGKMLALCECQGLPDPKIMAKDGPRWLYCLPWYVGKDPKWNPPDWVKEVHGHEAFITLDRLPKWTSRTALPSNPQP